MVDNEKATPLLQETPLFIEAAHSCNLRISMGAEKEKAGIAADIKAAGSKAKA